MLDSETGLTGKLSSQLLEVLWLLVGLFSSWSERFSSDSESLDRSRLSPALWDPE